MKRAKKKQQRTSLGKQSNSKLKQTQALEKTIKSSLKQNEKENLKCQNLRCSLSNQHHTVRLFAGKQSDLSVLEPPQFKYQASFDEKKTLCFNLQSYDKVLDERLISLRKKWNQIKILEKNIHNSIQIGNSNCSSVQNDFYISKITELQNELKSKEKDIRKLRERSISKASVCESDICAQNKRIKEQKWLLERQNEILKKKLKDLEYL